MTEFQYEIRVYGRRDHFYIYIIFIIVFAERRAPPGDWD